MNVIKMNKGKYIPYTLSKTKLTFDDELTRDLQKLERDDDVTIDICRDKLRMLTTGLGESYVAQIEIPARQYMEVTHDNPEYNPEDEGSSQTIVTREAVPFSTANVTLRLFAID